MNSQIREEFDKMDISRLADKSGVVHWKKRDMKKQKAFRQHTCIGTIGEEEFILKRWKDLKSIGAMTISEIYRDAGIETPQVLPITGAKVGPTPPFDTIQKMMRSKGGLQVRTLDEAVSDEFFYKLRRKFPDVKSVIDVFKYPEIEQQFLEVMTKQCFDEYMLAFIVGALPGEVDGHAGNVLVWKPLGAERYEGIIQIDQEEGEIFPRDICSKEDLNDFVEHGYYIRVNPLQGSDACCCHSLRIDELNRLIGKGVLSDLQIKKLLDVINADAGSVVKKVCKSPALSKDRKQAYESFSRVWEYNREHLTELERC